MLKLLKHLKFTAFALPILAAQNGNADQLFTNWSSAVAGGILYAAGGPCSLGSCFAMEDNFSNAEDWVVTDFTFYMVSLPEVIADPHWRYALFNAAGDQIVAPTDTALTVTDMGSYSDSYVIYKAVISGLSISLPSGEYWFRFTNTQYQGVFPAYGVSPSTQTLSPGFRQLTGSSTVESLLSTDATQRDENWAFEVAGTEVPVFRDGFEQLAQVCAPIANPDHFVVSESAGALVALGNALANDQDNCGGVLIVTGVDFAVTPFVLSGTGSSLTAADITVVKMAAGPGEVATFRVTTADNADADLSPQDAYLHIQANGDEYLENYADAFSALEPGQSLTFNFTYSNSDGLGGVSYGTQDVTITGL